MTPIEVEMTPERQQAHALLDLLPDHKLQAVRSLLEVMVEPLGASLATAPVEEEEITPETAAALDGAKASSARGEGFAHEDILHEFDLKRRANRNVSQSSGRRKPASSFEELIAKPTADPML